MYDESKYKNMVYEIFNLKSKNNGMKIKKK